MSKLPATLLLLCTLFASACGGGSLVISKPKNAQVNSAVTDLWARDIRRVARSGDWILTRSYSITGDAVVGVTLGESFSHAVVYDAERDTIIEAINPVVREVSLEALLARNRYAVVVRPIGISEQKRHDTLARARSVIGRDFDYFGMIGLDDESSFYCSELAAWASQIPNQPLIVTPADLYERGELIYISGMREDKGLQVAAFASKRLHVRRVAEMGN